MTTTAKLFMSGRSQAIRLPAKLRLNAKEVRVEQIGDALWMQPQALPGQNMADWLRAFYEATEPLPESFLADRDDAPPQVRDWT
ncbi:MAG: AbrB family transcriptional regulator [Variovorax sp.]|nr:AbrB family transcriptional regulator [Variovorax sp.]